MCGRPNTSHDAYSPISSEGNELLVQFVSDLSVTADGFSASYKMLPRDSADKRPASSPEGGVHPGPPTLSPSSKPEAGPKVKPPTKPKVQPVEKSEALPEAQGIPVSPSESGKGERRKLRPKGIVSYSFLEASI